MWVEWLLFSGIAIAALMLFRSRFYGKLRGAKTSRVGGLIGEVGVVEGGIEAGGTGRLELRGTTWSARNIGDGALQQNDRARVEAVSGVTVDVRAADQGSFERELERELER